MNTLISRHPSQLGLIKGGLILTKTFDINSLLKERDEYEKVKNDLKEKVQNDFTSVTEKGTIIVKDASVELPLGNILVNLFLLSTYEEKNIDIYKDDLMLEKVMSQGDLENYQNKILERIKEHDENDFDYYKKATASMNSDMSDFGQKINKVAGNTIDLLDFIEAERDDEDAKNLFSVDIPYGLQFNEIEGMFKKKGNDLLHYFNTHPERNLSIFTRSQTGINVKQATQTLSFIGLKPTFDGGDIPKVITSNFLHGLTNIEDYLIIAKGARLALATNHKMVRISGYLTRKLALLNIDNWHDNDLIDCGTKHYVDYSIDNQKKLNMIDGRNYYDFVDGSPDREHIKVVNPKDLSLIGKKIALRSPICCCGKHVCRTCYGNALSEINKNINTGLVAVLELTDILTQRLLSAKHLLSTNTDKVEWGDVFEDSLTVNMDCVYFSEDTKTDLVIKYPTEDDYNEDMDAYEIKEFEIKSESRKSAHYISPVPLYISALIVPKKYGEKPDFKISSDSFGTDSEIFKFIPHNNMLSKSLQNILDLIETSDHLGITNYSDLANKFSDLLIENGMDSINSVHGEMILSRLISDAKTGKRVDWKTEVLSPYNIDRVSKAVMNAPVSTSLSFERLAGQFSSLDTYLKDENSIMDYLFE